MRGKEERPSQVMLGNEGSRRERGQSHRHLTPDPILPRTSQSLEQHRGPEREAEQKNPWSHLASASTAPSAMGQDVSIPGTPSVSVLAMAAGHAPRTSTTLVPTSPAVVPELCQESLRSQRHNHQVFRVLETGRAGTRPGLCRS